MMRFSGIIDAAEVFAIRVHDLLVEALEERIDFSLLF